MVGRPKRFSIGMSRPRSSCHSGNEPTPDMDGAKTEVAVGVEWSGEHNAFLGLKGWKRKSKASAALIWIEFTATRQRSES